MRYIRTFELKPDDSHKSFYKKAFVEEWDNGDKRLFSYGTLVCIITSEGNFIRTWGGWSATTQRHVNAFLSLYGITEMHGKANWLKMRVAR